jgi:hypothetical protein
VQFIFVRLVELDSLLDDGLIVIVRADAAILERARISKATRCDFKRDILAICVFIDPCADGEPLKRSFEL